MPTKEKFPIKFKILADKNDNKKKSKNKRNKKRKRQNIPQQTGKNYENFMAAFALFLMALPIIVIFIALMGFLIEYARNSEPDTDGFLFKTWEYTVDFWNEIVLVYIVNDLFIWFLGLFTTVVYFILGILDMKNSNLLNTRTKR